MIGYSSLQDSSANRSQQYGAIIAPTRFTLATALATPTPMTPRITSPARSSEHPIPALGLEAIARAMMYDTVERGRGQRDERSSCELKQPRISTSVTNRRERATGSKTRRQTAQDDGAVHPGREKISGRLSYRSFCHRYSFNQVAKKTADQKRMSRLELFPHDKKRRVLNNMIYPGEERQYPVGNGTLDVLRYPSRITRAGTPATTQPGGTSSRTKE